MPGVGITITSLKPATIPLTGVAFGTSTETYGGQVISSIPLNATNNQMVNITLAPAW